MVCQILSLGNAMKGDKGDRNIHFPDGLSLYGDAPQECTVDGAHATDLRFHLIAGRMAPVIERILSL